MKFALAVLCLIQVVLGFPADPDTEERRCFCGLVRDQGICIGVYHAKYFYNTETNKCEAFTWSGCMGNWNRFDSMEACQETCTGFDKAITTEKCQNAFQSKKCQVQNPAPEGGVCEKCGGCMDWYYTHTLGGCVKKGVCVHRTPLTFLDRVNYFKTKEECEAACPNPRS